MPQSTNSTALLVTVTLSLALGSGCLLPRRPSVDDTFTARTPTNLPELPNGRALRVLVIGDFGTGGEGQREVAAAIARTHAVAPPDLLLTVGDNFYPRGVSSVEDPLWEEVFESVYTGSFWDSLVFRPVLGNHDSYGNWGAQIEYSERNPRWDMPGNYYAFSEELPRGGSVLLMALDTNLLEDGGGAADSQVRWAESILTESGDRWILAFGHHPLATAGWRAPSRGVRDRLVPAFSGRVPVYLAGHNHTTELLPVNDDLLQVVCGGGGGQDNPYKVDPTPETLAAFTNGGWCFLHLWSDVLAIELYNRAGTLRYRHLVYRQPAESP